MAWMLASVLVVALCMTQAREVWIKPYDHVRRVTQCMSGPDNDYANWSCWLYDLDQDRDVDLCDVSQMLSVEVLEVRHDG